MSDLPTPLEALTLALCRIESVIGDESAIADYVAAWLAAEGISDTQRVANNVIARAPAARERAPVLLLLGHLDTVPRSDANPPRLDGDRLYGLGASDMKAADAVMLAALAQAARTPGPYELRLVLYSGEEGPYAGSGLPVVRAARPDIFEGVDLALCMEPTDNALEFGCLGTMHAEVHFQGQRAHSARPWQGRNALHMAGPLLQALAELGPRDVILEGLAFREVASATMMRYEGARNVVPGSCTVNVNLRFTPDRSPADAEAHLAAIVRGACPEAWWNEGWIDIELTDLAPSGHVCSGNALVDALVAAAPTPPARRPKLAWTDVGRLSQWGIDAVNWGPGSGAQAHQVGEWCLRPQLQDSWATLQRLCGWA